MRPQELERLAIRNIVLSGHFDFEETAFRIFHFQYQYNALYQAFCRNLGRTPADVVDLKDIPFLPIRFFKSHPVQTGDFKPELIFLSSGTTVGDRSRHLVRDKSLYDQVSRSIFESYYSNPDEYIFLALLPSYLEQGDSSLVHMVHAFMAGTSDQGSGFYLRDFERLSKDLARLRSANRKIILWGVTYALLDFAEQYPMREEEGLQTGVHPVTVVETGGMKGRRTEWLRSEVHQRLDEALFCGRVHSEYGMTELLSQAYSYGDGIFQMSHTMRILAFDVMDPLTYAGDGTTGACHVIDLANLDSCSFIATQDLCRTDQQTFEILGRMDYSEIRGCNLMYGGGEV